MSVHGAPGNPAHAQRMAANLASLNEIMAEIVQALADHGWSDPEFAQLTRQTLCGHSWGLGFAFNDEGPHEPVRVSWVKPDPGPDDGGVPSG